MPDRRDPQTQPIPGGRRATDPSPLSTRECADLIGVDSDYIREAIHAGELKAEKIERPNRRPLYRVHEDDFLAWLLAIKWSRIPARFRATGTS